MKRLLPILTLVAIMVLPAIASAQRFDTSQLGLANNKAVAKDAGFLDEQIEALAELKQTIDKKFPRPKVRDRAKFAKWSADKAKAAAPRLKKILFPPQLMRLEQIQTQVLGSRAFTLPRITKALKIDKEQKAKIAKIQTDARGKFVAIFQKAGNDRAKMMKMFRELNAQITKDCTKVLTKKQATAFTKLKGKPFKFPSRSRGKKGKKK